MELSCYSLLYHVYPEPCDILHSSSSRERHLALEKQQSGSNRLYTATYAVTLKSTDHLVQARVCSQYAKTLSPAVYR
jgi:hypothetical protein